MGEELREKLAELHSAQVRLAAGEERGASLETQLEQKSNEAKRVRREADLYRAEVGEERAMSAVLRDKYDLLKAHQKQMEDLRGSFVDEANEASAELRTVQMSLEQEQSARKLSDDAKNFLVLESSQLRSTIKELSATAEFISQENGRLKAEAGNTKVMKVVGRFMVRKMREKLLEAQASEASMRAGQNELNTRLVRSEQKSAAIETELKLLRRRTAEREAAFEQQRADASDLSVANRMLVESKDQLMIEAQRARAKHDALANDNVELAADLDMLREKMEVMDALGRFRPEELASVSRTNAALAESIQALLPKLDKAGTKGMYGMARDGVPAAAYARSAAPAALPPTLLA